MDKSRKVQNIRLVYCPVHQGIQEIELEDSLSPSELQQGNALHK